MKIDISKELQSVAPWDLAFTYDGTDYPTRRPTLGLVSRFQGMNALNADAEQSLKMVGEIFEQPGPDLESWSNDAILAAMAGYVEYFNGQSKVFSKAIATQMKVAMAQTTTEASNSQS